jgi:hypothetical protein
MDFNLENIVGSTYFFSILVLFLIFYGPRLSPKLPDGIRNLFNSQAFRSLVMFLVIFSSNKKLGLVMSLVIVIIFMVIMNILQTGNLFENLKKEHFSGSNWGPSPISCSTYDMAQAEFVGQPFYPLNDRNNLLSEAPFYSPVLDYSKILQETSNNNKLVLAETENNVNQIVSQYKEMF